MTVLGLFFLFCFIFFSNGLESKDARCLRKKHERWWHNEHDESSMTSDDPFFKSFTTDYQPSHYFDSMDADEDLLVFAWKGYYATIYRRDDDTTLWKEESVVAVDFDPSFGDTVSCSSEVDLIVFGSNSDYIYIFDYDPVLRQWFQALRFRPDDWKEGDRFGSSVLVKSSSRQNRILISAPGADGGTGKIYSYAFERPEQMVDKIVYKSVKAPDAQMTGSKMDYDIDSRTLIFTTQRDDTQWLNLIPNGDQARAQLLTFTLGKVSTPSLFLFKRDTLWFFVFGWHNPEDQTRRVNAIIADETFGQFRSVQSESIQTLDHSAESHRSINGIPNDMLGNWLHVAEFPDTDDKGHLLAFMSNPTYTEQDRQRGAVFYVDFTDPFQLPTPQKLPTPVDSVDTYFGRTLESTVYELIVSEQKGSDVNTAKVALYYSNIPAPHKPSNLFRSQDLNEIFGYPSPIQDISMNGHRIVIGRIGMIDVYYYDYDYASWNRTFSVMPPESVQTKEEFGSNIHYSETEDLMVVLLKGQIHLYDYVEGSGFEYACEWKLPDSLPDETYTVCATGNKIFFGVPQRLTAKSKGVVYAYHYRTGCRLESMTRIDMDAMQDPLALNAEFGADIAFDVPSQRLFVGAPGYGDTSVGGAVVHFPTITDPSEYDIQKGFSPSGRFGNAIDSVYYNNVIYYIVGAPGADNKRGRAVGCQLVVGESIPTCKVLDHDTFDYDGNYGLVVRVGVYANKNSEYTVAGFTSVANMYHPPTEDIDIFVRPYPKGDDEVVKHFGGVAMYDLSKLNTIPRMYYSMIDEGREYAYGSLIVTGRFEVMIVGNMYQTEEQILTSLEGFEKPMPPTPPPVPRPSHGPTYTPTRRPTSAPFLDKSVSKFTIAASFVGVFLLFTATQLGLSLFERARLMKKYRKIKDRIA